MPAVTLTKKEVDALVERLEGEDAMPLGKELADVATKLHAAVEKTSRHVVALRHFADMLEGDEDFARGLLRAVDLLPFTPHDAPTPARALKAMATFVRNWAELTDAC
jgi:predicted metal-dependent HD superfamily phosphohydrolase